MKTSKWSIEIFFRVFFMYITSYSKRDVHEEKV